MEHFMSEDNKKEEYPSNDGDKKGSEIESIEDSDYSKVKDSKD